MSKMGGTLAMLNRLVRDWQYRLVMLMVGAVLILLSAAGILRFVDIIQMTGYTNIDTLIFGLLAAVGLMGLGCLVESLVLQLEDREDWIDDKRR